MEDHRLQDRQGGGTRSWIIDYKTGRVEERDLKLENLDDLIANPGLSMSFQLLSYAYLFNSWFDNSKQKIRAGIIPLKKVSDGFLEVSVPSLTGGKSGSL